MAKRIGEENHKFIYNGLNSKNYHKAAKKYFDNLIYKIKNQMGTLWMISNDLHVLISSYLLSWIKLTLNRGSFYHKVW